MPNKVEIIKTGGNINLYDCSVMLQQPVKFTNSAAVLVRLLLFRKLLDAEASNYNGVSFVG